MADKIHKDQRKGFPLSQLEYARRHCGNFKGHRRKLRAIFNSSPRSDKNQVTRDLSDQMRNATLPIKLRTEDKNRHSYTLPGCGDAERLRLREMHEMTLKRLPVTVRLKPDKKQAEIIKYYLPSTD